jgi:hypothetical protein
MNERLSMMREAQADVFETIAEEQQRRVTS